MIFTLVLQVAGPGDPVDDSSRGWPTHRPLLPAVRLTLTCRSADETRWQQQVFDTTNVAAGVELSDDPVLRFRRQAYGVSAARRLGTHPHGWTSARLHGRYSRG